MLKLVRNYNIDHGVRMPSGSVGNRSVSVKLLGVDNAEFRLCHKLTMRHVTSDVGRDVGRWKGRRTLPVCQVLEHSGKDNHPGSLYRRESLAKSRARPLRLGSENSWTRPGWDMSKRNATVFMAQLYRSK